MLNKIQRLGYIEWIAFFVVAVLGFGSSFYWIKVAVRDVRPADLIVYRSVISATFLWTMVAVMRVPLPKNWSLIAKVLFAGVMGGALPNTLISWGETHIDSSVAGILISLCPTFTAVFSAFWIRPYELSGFKILGIAVGFCGVYVMIAPTWGINSIVHNLLPELAVIMAAMCYSLFSVFAKLNFSKEHPLALAAISATASASIMLPIAINHHGGFPSLPGTASAWCAILWIGIITSAVSQVLVYYLVGTWGPARLSLITYIMPLVALALGIVCLDEWPNSNDLYGGSLILLSVYLINAHRLQNVTTNRPGNKQPLDFKSVGAD